MKILILFLVFLLSCKEEPFSVNNPPPGALKLTALDTLGNLAMKGWIRLSVTSDSHISGEWQIDSYRERSYTRLFNYRGTIGGRYEPPLLEINLNPDWVDNNVILWGNVSDNICTGSWHYSGFSSTPILGTFELRP